MRNSQTPQAGPPQENKRKNEMGCDIHTYVEVRDGNTWKLSQKPIFHDDEGNASWDPFSWRSYAMFTLLAGVSNQGYGITPISEPRGIPADISEPLRSILAGKDWWLHSHSWLTLRELQAVDATQEVDYRGERTALGDFLGGFFDDVAALAQLGNPDDVRVVFAFDS